MNSGRRMKMDPKEEVLANEEDDDCIILEGDPYAPSLLQNVSEASTDDFVVISEKGKVACRDYPHPRHLCAAFPFASTLHVEHCDQCYCYVCDSAAPCSGWGTGISEIDHCHATDKEQSWRIRRKCGIHDGKKSAPVPQSATNSTAQHLTTQYSGKSTPVPQSPGIALANNPQYSFPCSSYGSQHYTDPSSGSPHYNRGPQNYTICPYSSPHNSYESQHYTNPPYNLPYYGYGSSYANPQYSSPYSSYGSRSYANPPT